MPKFNTKKWREVQDQSNGTYSTSEQIMLKGPMLWSDLCDCSDAYIVAKETITVTGADNRDRKNIILILKNNAPFTSCISKFNNTQIDNAEDLDVVIPTYNLIEYSKNYSKTSSNLWNYYRDESNNPTADNYNADLIVISESFKYKQLLLKRHQAMIIMMIIIIVQ